MTDKTVPPAAAGLAREIIRTRQGDERAYYDAKADARARKSYYADVKLTGRPAAVYTRLHKLLKKTHKTELTYKVARLRHLYPWIDLQPDTLTLQSIYSGGEIAVEAAMLHDLQAMAKTRPQMKTYAQLSDLAAFLEDEADEEAEFSSRTRGVSGRYNCEHAVPQSWFGRRQPMRADLHHLFTCDPLCNSFRGNFAYFDFLPTLDNELSDCGRRAPAKFEPAFNQGVVARATLYFLLRYPDEIGDWSQEMGPERLEILIRWHEAQAPALYEHHRNAGIMAVQGNRNPLIDFPELARRIDFTRGFA